MFKIIFSIIILIVAIDATAISWGYIRNGHVLLFDQFFYNRDNIHELKPREFFFSSRGIRITAIHVTDLTGLEGGTAEILQGGIGYTYVKMKLIPDLHKMLLNVEIFGAHDDRYTQ